MRVLVASLAGASLALICSCHDDPCVPSDTSGFEKAWATPTAASGNIAFFARDLNGTTLVAHSSPPFGPSSFGHLSDDGEVVDDATIQDQGEDVVLDGMAVAADGAVALMMHHGGTAALVEATGGVTTWRRELPLTNRTGHDALVASIASDGWLVSSEQAVSKFDRAGDELWHVDLGFGSVTRMEPTPDGAALVDFGSGDEHTILDVSGELTSATALDLEMLPYLVLVDGGSFGVSTDDDKVQLAPFDFSKNASTDTLYACAGRNAVATALDDDKIAIAGLDTGDAGAEMTIWLRVVDREGKVLAKTAIPTSGHWQEDGSCWPRAVIAPGGLVQVVEGCVSTHASITGSRIRVHGFRLTK